MSPSVNKDYVSILEFVRDKLIRDLVLVEDKLRREKERIENIENKTQY